MQLAAVVNRNDENSKGEGHTPAISDGGSTGNIMSEAAAKELIKEGIITEIIPVQPGKMSVIFGKAGALEPVIGEIRTKGI